MERSPTTAEVGPSGWWWRTCRWWHRRSGLARVGLVSIPLLATVGACLAFLWHRQMQSQQRMEIATHLWHQYRLALDQRDEAGVEAALEQLLRADPASGSALALYHAWIDKQSTPETGELAPLLLQYHLRRQNLLAAEREAERLVQRQPKYWLAHCVRLHACLQRHALLTPADVPAVVPTADASPEGVPATIQSLLAAFPDPEDPEAHTTPGGLLYALHLWPLVGRDTQPLCRLIERRVLPLLRTARATEAPPVQQLQFLECFLAVAQRSDDTATLAGYWSAVDQLTALALQQAYQQQDIEAVRYWLLLAPRGENLLQQWQQRPPPRVTSQQLEPMLRDWRWRRQQAALCWRRWAPAEPDPYFHLIEIACQENDLHTAFAYYREALQNSSDPLPIWERLVPFLASRSHPLALRPVRDALWQQAEQQGNDPRLWCLAAQGALLVQDFEQAMQACRRARAIQPNYPQAGIVEATLWLRSGEYPRARTILETLGTSYLRQHEELAYLYGRCLVSTARQEEIIQQYQRLFPSGSPPPAAIAFMRGVAEQGRGTPPLLRWVIQQIQPAAVQAHPEACRLFVEVRYRLAEALVQPHPSGGPAIWDQTAVDAALAACALLNPHQRHQPEVLLAQATLYAFGRRQPEVALRLVKPLLQPPQAGLTAAQQLALAYVLLANHRAQPALTLLHNPAMQSCPPAGWWIARAWAYLQLQQPQAAAEALYQATLTPTRTAREQADWATVKHLLQQELPP